MSNPFDNSRPTILCGYGALGKEIARNAKAVGVRIWGVFDNDAEGVFNRTGYSVLTKDWFDNIDGLLRPVNEHNFVICAIRQQARTELQQQLEALGAKHIYHATDLLRAYPNLVALARPGMPDDCAKLLETIDLYEDLYSDHVMMSIAASWIGDSPCDEPISDIADIYFPDFIKPLPHEVLVDVGAFTGDTVQAFLDHRGDEYGVIVAIEPDQENHAKLKAFAGGVKNMMTFNGAASDHNGRLEFLTSGDQASRQGFKSDGAKPVLVTCATIDYIAEMMDCIPSYIKADCEGGELSVIEGARETIQKYMPCLAFVGYHHPRDLWELPRKMLEIAPGYKLFLRKYALAWFESVIYAVPPDRVDWEKV